MKLKYRLGALERERDRYLDFMRSEQSITRGELIGICSEVARLQHIIKSIKNLTLGHGEIESNTYTYEIPSSMNKAEPVKRKKYRPLPNVQSTWGKTF